MSDWKCSFLTDIVSISQSLSAKMYPKYITHIICFVNEKNHAQMKVYKIMFCVDFLVVFF